MQAKGAVPRSNFVTQQIDFGDIDPYETKIFSEIDFVGKQKSIVGRRLKPGRIILAADGGRIFRF